MRATVTSKGHVTIPSLIRAKAKIVTGSQLEFEFKDETTLIIHLVSQDISRLKGCVKNKRRRPVTLKEMKNAIAFGSQVSMK